MPAKPSLFGYSSVRFFFFEKRANLAGEVMTIDDDRSSKPADSRENVRHHRAIADRGERLRDPRRERGQARPQARREDHHRHPDILSDPPAQRARAKVGRAVAHVVTSKHA